MCSAKCEELFKTQVNGQLLSLYKDNTSNDIDHEYYEFVKGQLFLEIGKIQPEVGLRRFLGKNLRTKKRSNGYGSKQCCCDCPGDGDGGFSC